MKLQNFSITLNIHNNDYSFVNKTTTNFVAKRTDVCTFTLSMLASNAQLCLPSFNVKLIKGSDQVGIVATHSPLAPSPPPVHQKKLHYTAFLTKWTYDADFLNLHHTTLVNLA